jgi:FKBP-type peptidyl-prolyl cis-trans isomerase
MNLLRGNWLLSCTLVLFATSLAGCEGTSGATKESPPDKLDKKAPFESNKPFSDLGDKPVKTTKNGVKYVDIKTGTGDAAEGGDRIECRYTGWLTSGKEFDSNRNGIKPLAFVLGARDVIRGWDEGIPGMQVGGKRRLLIPADLAYGKSARGPIPANSDLVFDVELVRIVK